MTRRILIALAWGLAGLAIAAGLTVGAFALAGEEISKPAVPVVEPVDQRSPGPDTDDRTATPEPTGSASPDDHGGTATHDAGEDHANSGSATDSNSGSGSDDSGSDPSSSGSGEHGDD